MTLLPSVNRQFDRLKTVPSRNSLCKCVGIFTLQIRVLRDIHLCFNIFLTITFILTLIGEPRLHAYLAHALLFWTPIKSGFCFVIKFLAKITGKNFEEIPFKIKEFVTEMCENLDVDDSRSNGGQVSQADSPSKPEDEAYTGERNTDEKDVKNDNDDNVDVDVGASYENEKEVGQNNESDDYKTNGRKETTSTTYWEEFGN